jgi:hypothetical protein
LKIKINYKFDYFESILTILKEVKLGIIDQKQIKLYKIVIFIYLKINILSSKILFTVFRRLIIFKKKQIFIYKNSVISSNKTTKKKRILTGMEIIKSR